MEALGWSHKGLEEVSAQEIRKAGATKVRILNSFLLFEVKDFERLCRICYTSQSLRGLMLLLGRCKTSELKNELVKADLSIVKGNFAVRVKRFDAEIESHDIAVLAGDIIAKKTGAKVSLSQPDVIMLVLVQEDSCFFGIDFAGIDLGKRDYKIFSTRGSLKGSFAYGMLAIAGFRQGSTLIDPFARDGVIGIEAVLLALQRSAHFFQKDKLAFSRLELDFSLEKAFARWDKAKSRDLSISMYDTLFHNIQYIRKNAKIAGVGKEISVSGLGVDWLDTKWDKGSVDIIASYPPQLTRNSDEKKIIKLYDELFHQAAFVLKQKGRVVLAMRDPELLAKVSHELRQKQVVRAYQGKELLHIVVFQKL